MLAGEEVSIRWPDLIRLICANVLLRQLRLGRQVLVPALKPGDIVIIDNLGSTLATLTLKVAATFRQLPGALDRAAMQDMLQSKGIRL
jgi:hypothetical protein